jgi:hypothetical protein
MSVSLRRGAVVRIRARDCGAVEHPRDCCTSIPLFLVFPSWTVFWLAASLVALCVLGIVKLFYWKFGVGRGMGVFLGVARSGCGLLKARDEKKPARQSGLEPLSMESQGRDTLILSTLSATSKQVFMVSIFFF